MPIGKYQITKPKLQTLAPGHDPKHQTLNTIHKGLQMKITKDEIAYVAKLARLELDEATIETFSEQIGDILVYIDKLNEVDTDGVPPTSHAIFLSNAFRDDKPVPHLDRTLALKNAPEKEDGDFLVPKVVG